MGAEESFQDYSNHGYRVLDIEEGSPISKTDIERFVDFICYEPDSSDSSGLDKVIKSFEEKEMSIQVYNVITRMKRTVIIVPSYNWSGFDLIGASVRYEDFTFAHCRVYYVKSVDENSPAEQAGLLAESDYIVGSRDCDFQQIDDIGNLSLKACIFIFDRLDKFNVYDYISKIMSDFIGHYSKTMIDKSIHLYIHNVFTRK